MIGGKMNLLAIPNDSIKEFKRIKEEDFLNEFNPEVNKKRFFDNVSFLNWKGNGDEEYAGIKEIFFDIDKEKALELTEKLKNGELKFDYPLYHNIYIPHKKQLISKANSISPNFVRTTIHPFAIEMGEIIREELKIPLIIVANDISRINPGLKTADSLVCISDAMKKECSQKYGINPEKITVIPDGINMNLFSPIDYNQTLQKVEKKYDSKYKILSVGRIVPNKNLETLLKSINLSKRELNGLTHLHLGVGSEKAVQETKRLIKELNIDENSYLLGGIQQKELPFYYSWADVYTLPTLWEGLGRAQIEALACGTPVITTNYAPMTEIVQENYNGLIADPRNPEKWAEKIVTFFKDTNLQNKLKRNSRPSVLEKYSVKKTMQLHYENYKKLNTL